MSDECDIVNRLRTTPEIVLTEEDEAIADLADEAAEEIIRLRDRIQELEERLHERDLAVATLAQQCDELLALVDRDQHFVTQDIMTED